MEDSEAGRINKEYVIQHFETDPSFLIEDICEDFKETVSGVLQDIKGVIQRKKAGKFDESELDRKMLILENDYHAYFDKKCQTLDKALNTYIFKIPKNVLLKEDLVWENLSQSDATDQCSSLLSDMEKEREKYKNILYNKTYLRNYIEKMKQACIYQEELIQKEANLKEKNGIQDTTESLKFLLNKWEDSKQQLNKLNLLKEKVIRKRSLEDYEFSTEKRLKLQERLNEKERMLKTELK